MKGILVNQNGAWMVGDEGKFIKLHPDSKSYDGKPLRNGQIVEFDIVPIQKREMREFTGSFSITVENVAKLR